MKIVSTKIAFYSALGTVFIAVMGLLRYIPGLSLFASMNESFIPMAPSTAVSFILLAGILLLVTNQKRSIHISLHRISLAAAVLVALFAALELVEAIFGMALNFENRVVPELGHLGEIPIARMSVSTGALFFLAALALIALLVRSQTSRRKLLFENLSNGLGTVVFGSSLVFSAAYLFGSPFLYGHGSMVSMALTTALAFMLLGLAIVVRAGEHGFAIRAVRYVFRPDNKPFSPRGRLALLISVMVGVAGISMAILLLVLYRHEYNQREIQLLATAESQTQLMRLVAKENFAQSEALSDEDPGYSAYEATLNEFTMALSSFHRMDHTTEFTLAQLKGDSIVFLLTRQKHGAAPKRSVHMNANWAEPQRRALQGQAGSMVGLDYHGQTVLAAYDYIEELNLGVVVKIDVAEIRAPFIRAIITGTIITSIIILFGSLVFIWIGNPIVMRLESNNKLLQAEVNMRKQAEVALMESNEFKDSLLQTIPFALDIVDLQGKLLYLNPAMEAIIGKDALGNQCWLSYKDDQLQCTDCPLKQPIIEGETKLIESAGVFGGRYFEISHTKMIYQGQIALLEIFYDITARKQGELALLDSENRLRRVVTDSPVPLMIHTEDGEVLDLSKSWTTLSGYTLDDIPTISEWTEKAFGHRVEEFRASITENFAQEVATGNGEYAINTKSGESRTWDFQSAPLGSLPDGRRLVLSMASDETERRKSAELRHALESQMRRAQKLEAVGTMAAGISHSFNNILQAQLLHAEIVQRQLDVDSKLRINMQHIINAGNNARDLVSGVLTFSRDRETQLAPIEMQHLVKTTTELLRSIFPSRIKMETTIDMDAAPVIGDYTQIQQIILNLCNNALHAMGDSDGMMTVSFKEISTPLTSGLSKTGIQAKSLLELQVSDTGCGMKEETLEKIFDPFFTTKPVGQGTGLGLSVIHGIIEDMNGEIKVSSKEGHGSTFTVLLPTSQIQDIEESDIIQLKKTTWTQSVLVVDADPDIRNILNLILEGYGFKVYTSPSAVDALEWFGLEPGKYDLMISELSLPGMSGIELSKNTFALRPHFPIILMSGKFDSSVLLDCKNLGIRVLKKPWNEDDLLNEIRALNLE